MKRRHGLLGLAVAASGLGGVPGRGTRAGPVTDGLSAADYALFKARFVTPEGRVVDTGNGGISHSEGQGYGMLLAVAADDRTGFDELWVWTMRHLAVRGDGLLAWKHVPNVAMPAAADRNNATDGDLLVAWALQRAAERWGKPPFAAAAAGLARAVRAHAVRPTARGPMLLPAVDGFVHDGVATVNPSYWVFPALRDLDRVDPDPVWSWLVASGRALLWSARFGRYGLPPDWLLLSEPPAPSPLFPAAFGYNAVRVPLHLRWAALDDPALLAPFRRFWGETAQDAGGLPATFDLAADERGPHPASPGIRAIAALTAWRSGEPAPSFPTVDQARDYYGAVLVLLTQLASSEGIA